MRRAVLLAATMAIVAVLAAGMASADPVNSPKAPIVTLDCDNGEEVTVTFLLNPSKVFSVVGTTGNFVLTEGTSILTDLTTGEVFGGPFTVGQGKREGLPEDSLTTCTTTFEFDDPKFGPTEVELTGTGFFVPRKG